MATKQELQLEILSQEYSRFVKDQVLTEVQLNEIIDVFEEQHRLTRTCLIGTGIVCGLGLNRNGNTVTLSPGVAVTTDGDLLKIPASSFGYFIKYTPPDNSHYDPFYYKAGGEEKMITLYQLLSEEEKTALKSDTVHLIEDLDTTLQNWVAILYLEYYLKNPERCTPTNCDNMGIRQVCKPKLLILSKGDMDKIVQKDAGEIIGDDLYLKYHEAYKKYFTFPVIRARRVILNKSNTLKSTTLSGAYFTAAKSGSTALSLAIKQLYSAFSFLIDKSASIPIDTLTAKLTTQLSTATDTLQGQYTYDFYKDVVAAYNELRELLYNVAFECCPNIYAFPKHIMLGEPNIACGPQPPEYRHQFYPSPATSKNKELVHMATGMLERLKLLIENFSPESVDAIKITPTLDYDRPLGERAIPVYYNNIPALAKEWNYSRTLKAEERLNLSYHADQYTAPVRDEVLNPLDYEIDGSDFFRIEGHIGKVFSTALQSIDNIRSSKGVPFDLVALRLGDAKLSDLNLDDFPCYFEDLNTILQAFQTEINCLLSEGSRFFSGFTANRDKPHINQIRYVAQEGLPTWVMNDAMFKAIEIDPATHTKAIARESAPALAAVEASKTSATTTFCDLLTKPVFASQRIVKSKIELDPTTFGKYFSSLLDTEPVSVDAFVEGARKLAASDRELNALNENERSVAFEYPMQIIGHLNYMQRFIPASITEINDNLITSYKEFSQTFCNKIKTMHTRLEEYFRTADYQRKGFETIYLNMLDNLQRLCCGNEKLEVIMKEIEKRKKELLQRLSFANYAEQHPGLEHKAGVHRGGTFVIVYAGSESTQTSQLQRKEYLFKNPLSDTGIATSGEPTTQQYRDTDAFALSMVSNEGGIDKEAELARFFAFQKVTPGSPVAERLIGEVNTKIVNIRQIFCRELNPPVQDIVIADFSLPYLCCSDCPPVAFVMPKERARLLLPTGKSCTNQAPIPFSAYSPKGAVIASVEAPDAIIQGDAPSFDPSKVPDTAIGIPITFTLDGEATACTIIVKKPVAIILSAYIPYVGTDYFVVEFRNNTDETLSGTNTYLWHLNDGTPDRTISGNASFGVQYIRADLKAKGIDKLQATVTIPLDPCGSTATLNVEIPAPPVDTCKNFVLEFIKSKEELVNTEEFKKQLYTVADTFGIELLPLLYDNTIKVLQDALVAIENSDQELKRQLIMASNDMLQRIYKFQVNTDQQEVARIVEELLRLLLMLMLNLVRCDQEIQGNNLEVIISNLSWFDELHNQLQAKYQQLDQKNLLETDIKEYVSSFASQNPDLSKKLEVILEILSSFPE